MGNPTLNIVIFILQQITRDRLIGKMSEVIQSLSNHGISVGLVSDKNAGETKALLRTFDKGLFELFEGVVYSKNHLEINSFTELIEKIDDEFPLQTTEALVINPVVKEGQEYPLQYVIVRPDVFDSNFADTLQEYVGETFTFRKSGETELKMLAVEEVSITEAINGAGEEAGFQVTFEKKEDEVLIEEVKNESISV